MTELEWWTSSKLYQMQNGVSSIRQNETICQILKFHSYFWDLESSSKASKRFDQCAYMAKRSQICTKGKITVHQFGKMKHSVKFGSFLPLFELWNPHLRGENDSDSVLEWWKDLKYTPKAELRFINSTKWNILSYSEVSFLFCRLWIPHLRRENNSINMLKCCNVVNIVPNGE